MVLPLIAGLALKGVASGALNGALGGNQQQGASDPISNIFNSVLGGTEEKQQDNKDSLLNMILNPFSMLGDGQEEEQNQQKLPPFGKKPMMPPPMMNCLG